MNDYTQEPRTDFDALCAEQDRALRRLKRWMSAHLWGYRIVDVTRWMTIPIFLAQLMLLYVGGDGALWGLGVMWSNLCVLVLVLWWLRATHPKLIKQADHIEALTVRIRECYERRDAPLADTPTPVSPPPQD